MNFVQINAEGKAAGDAMGECCTYQEIKDFYSLDPLVVVVTHLLVSVGHLCDLQGLFSEIDNLRTVNRIEFQLMLT